MRRAGASTTLWESREMGVAFENLQHAPPTYFGTTAVIVVASDARSDNLDRAKQQ